MIQTIQTISADSSDVHRLNNIGKHHFSTKNYEEAKQLFLSSLTIDPDQLEILALMGVLFFLENNFLASISYLTKVIELQPKNSYAFSNRGLAYHHVCKYQEALLDFDNSITLDSSNYQAYLNQACTLIELEKYSDALDSLHKACNINQGCSTLHLNFAIVYSKIELYELALNHINVVIQADPLNAKWHLEKGLILQNMRSIDLAIESFKRCLEINPAYIDPAWNLSLLYLLKGDFVLGWELYEQRFLLSHFKHVLRNYSNDRLRDLFIFGKVVLVYHEQGFGDIIQFSRYVLLLKEFCSKVVLEVPTQLVTIMQSLSKDIQVVSSSEGIYFDLHTPLLSLPKLFATQLYTIPHMPSYLKPDKGKVQDWRNRINSHRMKVGLVITGSSHYGSKKKIPLRECDSLLNVEADFYILQNEISEDDLIYMKKFDNIYEYHKEIKDFSDTASLIANMDLVISVDTATAHLAGAIGKPVWVMLPFVADFRWLMNTSSSPWYPSATLYRQGEDRSFAPVIKNIASDIKSFKKLATQVEE